MMFQILNETALIWEYMVPGIATIITLFVLIDFLNYGMSKSRAEIKARRNKTRTKIEQQSELIED